MMDRIILDDISFEADEKGMIELLRIRPSSKHAGEFAAILREASDLARPKAAFAVAEAVPFGEDTMEIGNERFISKLLHDNLKDCGVVYPYLATCGRELEEWSRGLTGSLHSFWADAIMLMALGNAINRLDAFLKERLGSNIELSTMNPGSLPDWPLETQAALFSVMGDAAQAIGVELTEKMVIRPLKSVSGIHFLSEHTFISCRLCPRQKCPFRRAEYDPGSYALK